MKKILSIAVFVFIAARTFSQAGFVLPSPTDANDSLTIYIDIAQSAVGTSNNALKTHLQSHPDYADSVYIWTWAPSGEHDCGNGEWGNSNDCMHMTHVSGMLYSFKIVPTDFYNVSATTLFQNGISCLAKLDDGKEFESEGIGESKTEDFLITIIPKLCDDLFCVFPEASRPDDFISITYDNNQETIPELQGLGDEECYIYLYAHWDEDQFTGSAYVPDAQVTATPELKMKPVASKPGFFRLTFVPTDLFSELMPDGGNIFFLKYRILKPGFLYPGQPPQFIYAPLICE